LLEWKKDPPEARKRSKRNKPTNVRKNERGTGKSVKLKKKSEAARKKKSGKKEPETMRPTRDTNSTEKNAGWIANRHKQKKQTGGVLLREKKLRLAAKYKNIAFPNRDWEKSCHQRGAKEIGRAQKPKKGE